MRAAATYTAALGIASRGAQLQRSANDHLVDMTSSLKRSVELQSDAVLHQAETDSFDFSAATTAESSLESHQQSLASAEASERDEAAAAIDSAEEADLRERASALRTRVDIDEAQADSDVSESEELWTEAGALQVRSEQNRAQAAEDATTSVELREKATSEREAANVASARSIEENGLADMDAAEAAVEAGRSTEAEVAGTNEAEAALACQVVPLLDALCDAIGAVAELGTQSVAAFEAGAALRDGAAADALRVDADEEASTAAAMRGEAATDEAAAAELDAKSAEEQAEADAESAEEVADETAAGAARARGEEEEAVAQAEEERAAADEAAANEAQQRAAADEVRAEAEEAESEREELEAEEDMAESTEDSVEAAEEQAKADVEDEQGNAAAKEAIEHGFAAFRDTLLAITSSLLALLFFGWQVLDGFVVPAVGSLCSGKGRLEAVSSNGGALGGAIRSEKPGKGIFIARNVRHILLHVSSFIATTATFSTHFAAWEAYDVKSKGGLLLSFSSVAGLAEACFVHSMPRVLPLLLATAGFESVIRESSKCFLGMFLYLLPLVLIETLILLMSPLQAAFMERLPQALNPWATWTSFLTLTGVHTWYGGYESSAREHLSRQQSPTSSSMGGRQKCSETDALLDVYKSTYKGTEPPTDEEENEGSKQPTTFWSVCQWTSRYFQRLQLPFELLVLSCAFSIFWSSAANLRVLLSLIRSHHDSLATWVLTLAVFLTLLMVFATKAACSR